MENEIVETSVPYVCKNKRDIPRRTYLKEGNVNEIVKWCRHNFGDRGDGWDFTTGSLSRVYVNIWSSKLATMWELWQN